MTTDLTLLYNAERIQSKKMFLGALITSICYAVFKEKKSNFTLQTTNLGHIVNCTVNVINFSEKLYY